MLAAISCRRGAAPSLALAGLPSTAVLASLHPSGSVLLGLASSLMAGALLGSQVTSLIGVWGIGGELPKGGMHWHANAAID